jgi:hypothetical protein
MLQGVVYAVSFHIWATSFLKALPAFLWTLLLRSSEKVLCKWHDSNVIFFVSIRHVPWKLKDKNMFQVLCWIQSISLRNHVLVTHSCTEIKNCLQLSHLQRNGCQRFNLTSRKLNHISPCFLARFIPGTSWYKGVQTTQTVTFSRDQGCFCVRTCRDTIPEALKFRRMQAGMVFRNFLFFPSLLWG